MDVLVHDLDYDAMNIINDQATKMVNDGIKLKVRHPI